MPSRFANLLVFFAVLAVSVVLHRLVYRRLAGLIRKDFPRQASRLIRLAQIVFIVGDIPYLFLFFRNLIKEDLSVITRILLYPFTFWQFLLFVWAMILVPAAVFKRVRKKLPRLSAGPIFTELVRVPVTEEAYND